jgi:hypothetical protein
LHVTHLPPTRQAERSAPAPPPRLIRPKARGSTELAEIQGVRPAPKVLRKTHNHSRKTDRQTTEFKLQSTPKPCLHKH